MKIRYIQQPTYDRKKEQGLAGKSPSDYMKKKDKDQPTFLEVFEAALEKDIKKSLSK